MDVLFYLLTLLLAIAGPVLAITYLRPILVKVLRGLCDAEGGAEFWVRSAYVLAVCGTMLLMLVFGLQPDGATPVETLRRALLLVMGGVFVTVAFIAHSVWGQVRVMLAPRAAARPTTVEVVWPGDVPAATAEGAR
jgi:hypothetical protein